MIDGPAIAHQNIGQYAGDRRANLAGCAVGVDLHQWLVATYGVADVFEPSPDRQFDVGLKVGWYEYFRHHWIDPSIFILIRNRHDGERDEMRSAKAERPAADYQRKRFARRAMLN
jgi:hypothetical protein